MMQHSTAQHSTAQHSTAQHSTAQHSTAQHGTAQHSTAQHGTAQHNTAQARGKAGLNIPAALADIASIEKPSGMLALALALADSSTFAARLPAYITV